MSRLILIRHAQASFSPDPSKAFVDYDRLSELGHRQAEALGEELVAAGIALDRAYTGPAARQRQTAEGIAAVYARHGLSFPELRTLDALEEHSGATVVRRALAEPEYEAERVRLGIALEAAEMRGGSAGADSRESASHVNPTRAYFSVFQRVTRQWARGELPEAVADEGWQDFRARVEAGIRDVVFESGRGTTVAAFTSGGPIGSTVARVLGLDDEQALELAWTVENATLTELLFTEGRISLKSFNAQPRIGARELVTYV
jgi:broad specificity phosphatase PhoE